MWWRRTGATMALVWGRKRVGRGGDPHRAGGLGRGGRHEADLLLLRLVLDNNGNSDSDHADWAGIQITCS